MRTMLATILLALALAFGGASLEDVASAHTEQSYSPPTYCGHGWVEFWVPMPNGNVKHREYWQGGYGSGPHRHDYLVKRLAMNPPRWVIVHYHDGRQCPSHPV